MELYRLTYVQTPPYPFPDIKIVGFKVPCQGHDQ
jgi:hypothetical protein